MQTHLPHFALSLEHSQATQWFGQGCRNCRNEGFGESDRLDLPDGADPQGARNEEARGVESPQGPGSGLSFGAKTMAVTSEDTFNEFLAPENGPGAEVADSAKQGLFHF